MIQIQSAAQLTRAAERLANERMGGRWFEPHACEVTNKMKGARYYVRFTRRDGNLLASFGCSVGLRHGHRLLVCKHLAAVVISLREIQQMPWRR